jgi:hypothetical protein
VQTLAGIRHLRAAAFRQLIGNAEQSLALVSPEGSSRILEEVVGI